MERLPLDLRAVLPLDRDDLRRLCQSSKALNERFCADPHFWWSKIRREFPDRPLPGVPQSGEKRELAREFRYHYERAELAARFGWVPGRMPDQRMLKEALLRSIKERDLRAIHHLIDLWMAQNAAAPYMAVSRALDAEDRTDVAAALIDRLRRDPPGGLEERLPVYIELWVTGAVVNENLEQLLMLLSKFDLTHSMDRCGAICKAVGDSENFDLVQPFVDVLSTRGLENLMREQLKNDNWVDAQLVLEQLDPVALDPRLVRRVRGK